jgi:hypothetical protein
MLQCKKITEAPGTASFIVRFVALFASVDRQSQHSCRSADEQIAARFTADRAHYGEFASARRKCPR